MGAALGYLVLAWGSQRLGRGPTSGLMLAVWLLHGLALLAALPHDANAATVLGGDAAHDNRLRRSLLWRMLCELSSRLLEHAAPPVTPGAPRPEAAAEATESKMASRAEVAAP